MLLLIPVFLAMTALGLAAGSDPCVRDNHIEIDDPRRSSAHSPDGIENSLCDMTLRGGWYRFTSDAGGEIPDTCVPKNHCGTEIPIWLNGTHPTVAEGIVTRTLCAHYESRKESVACCELTGQTQIKNCGQFYVYYLLPVATCDMAYCAGNKQYCSHGHIGSTQNCQEIFPRLMEIPNLAGPFIEGDIFYFTCSFKTIIQTENDVFDVSWSADDLEIVNFTTTDSTSTLNGTLLTGFLNKKVGCSVRSYFATTPDRKSDWLASPKYWAGVKMKPQTLRINATIEDHEFFVIFTIPKTCAEKDKNEGKCSFSLLHGKNDIVDVISSGCQYQVSHTDWNDTIKESRVKVSFKVKQDHLWNGDRLTMFKFTPIWDNKGVFDGVILPPVPIHIQYEQDSKCRVYGDPHIKGMEYNQHDYHFFEVGDYTLYQNLQRNFEVQIRTFPCEEISCICAVAIRENNDLIIIDNCNNLRIGRKGISPMLKLPRDHLHIATVINQTLDGHGFGVYLSSSTEVKIVQESYGMDVDLLIPGSDMGQGKGICGTFDGNPDNEFTHRGGMVEQCEETWYCVPQDFFQSWSNNRSTSLFETVPALVNISRPQVYCECKENISVCDARAYIGEPVYQVRGHTIITKPEMPTSGDGSRRRRSADTEIQDDEAPVLPAYIPDDDKDVNSVDPVFPNWPTPSGITEMKAEELCRSAILGSQLSSVCNTSVVYDTQYLESCKIDILIMDSTDILEAHINTFNSYCQVSVATNPENYISTEDGELVLKEELKSVYKICKADCSINGQCVDGTCVCHPKYTGSNCNIIKDMGPRLHLIYGLNMNSSSEVCDVKIRPCRKVYLKASNFEYSNDLACKLQEISSNGSILKTHPHQEATFITSEMLACSVPNALTDCSNTTFAISVTMDGNVYGNKIFMTVFNSSHMCQQKNGCERLFYPSAILSIIIFCTYSFFSEYTAEMWMK